MVMTQELSTLNKKKREDDDEEAYKMALEIYAKRSKELDDFIIDEDTKE